MTLNKYAPVPHVRFGKNMKHLREEQSLTQKEFGNKLGVSQISISTWEIGRSLPTINQVVQLADKLDVAYEWLLFGETFENKNNNTFEINDLLEGNANVTFRGKTLSTTQLRKLTENTRSLLERQ